MVDIAPFRGLLFNQRKVGPTNQVTAPPYDVISLRLQSVMTCLAISSAKSLI